jgi:hypothetical protein
VLPAAAWRPPTSNALHLLGHLSKMPLRSPLGDVFPLIAAASLFFKVVRPTAPRAQNRRLIGTTSSTHLRQHLLPRRRLAMSQSGADWRGQCPRPGHRHGSRIDTTMPKLMRIFIDEVPFVICCLQSAAGCPWRWYVGNKCHLEEWEPRRITRARRSRRRR